MAKYYLQLGGGIGDALMNYIHEPIYRKLPDMKRQHPDLEVHVYSQVHNNGVEDLFWYHPVVTRHVHICQLPQHHQYECFDHDLLPRHPHLQAIGDLSKYRDDEPVFNLNDDEKRLLDKVFSDGKVTVIQPYAGLSCRDAFNVSSLKKMTEMLPDKKVIIGRNSPRVCVGRNEIGCDGQNVINLIDRVGIRFTYHLIKNCHAFIGSHSSIVLLAWHFNKPTVCIVPFPHQEHHWNHLDPKYKKGEGRENTLIAHIKTNGDRCPEDFDYDSLDYDAVTSHIKKYVG